MTTHPTFANFHLPVEALTLRTFPRIRILATGGNFSKVSVLVVSYSKWTSELTFANPCHCSTTEHVCRQSCTVQIYIKNPQKSLVCAKRDLQKSLVCAKRDLQKSLVCAKRDLQKKDSQKNAYVGASRLAKEICWLPYSVAKNHRML